MSCIEPKSPQKDTKELVPSDNCVMCDCHIKAVDEHGVPHVACPDCVKYALESAGIPSQFPPPKDENED